MTAFKLNAKHRVRQRLHDDSVHLNYALFGSSFLALGLIAYRSTRAARMVAQYPWQYRRAGLFGWREIDN